MPSGITADVYDGKINTAQQFFERVARSMTDFIHMRDESYDIPLTKRDVAGYYGKSVVEKQKELDDFLELDMEELNKMYREDQERIVEMRKEVVAKNDRVAERYDSMIAQVEAYDVPDEIAYAKEYALKYLQESRDFDVSDDPAKYYQDTGDFDTWFAAKRGALTQTLMYATRSYAEHLERDAEFNAKIDAWSKVVGYEIV